MAAAEAEKPEEEKVAAGELLFCGGTNWDMIGKKTGAAVTGNLVSPTRLRSLLNVDIRLVASGCASCHCVALDVEGRCYTWGRNEKGQLGHGDTHATLLEMPRIVSGLSKYKIVAAGAGRNHTVVVTDDGNSFAFGWNKHGQLGTGSTKNELERSPVRCLVSQVTNAVCGGDFTVWLSSLEGSSILTAGHPQYGQLGHGTNNEFNLKDASVKLAYEPQPRPRAIASLASKTIVKVACGTNHTVAVDSDGFVYTWGFGGYGRLGHREQKDEWIPRLVGVFQRHNVLPPTAVVSAGSVSSACTAGGGQLYMWGKLKTTGDEWMYPKPLMDLSGWNIRCMDSGQMHHFCGADDSCISWGQAQYGELGYGPAGQKSSANPKKVEILDGMHVISVACGMGHSLIVVDRTNVQDKLDELAVFGGENPEVIEELKDEDQASNKTLTKGAANASPANSKKRKKAKDSSESEDNGADSDFSEDANGQPEVQRGRRGGKASSRGRGKATKEVSTEGKKGSGRGRGRPRLAEKKSAESGSGRGRGKAGKRGRAK